MWADRIGRGLTAIARWIWKYPIPSAILAMLMLLIVSPGTFWYLVTVALIAGIAFQGVIRIFGYGHLWGKRKKSD